MLTRPAMLPILAPRPSPSRTFRLRKLLLFLLFPPRLLLTPHPLLPRQRRSRLMPTRLWPHQASLLLLPPPRLRLTTRTSRASGASSVHPRYGNTSANKPPYPQAVAEPTPAAAAPISPTTTTPSPPSSSSPEVPASPSRSFKVIQKPERAPVSTAGPSSASIAPSESSLNRAPVFPRSNHGTPAGSIRGNNYSRAPSVASMTAGSQMHLLCHRVPLGIFDARQRVWR